MQVCVRALLCALVSTACVPPMSVQAAAHDGDAHRVGSDSSRLRVPNMLWSWSMSWLFPEPAASSTGTDDRNTGGAGHAPETIGLLKDSVGVGGRDTRTPGKQQHQDTPWPSEGPTPTYSHAHERHARAKSCGREVSMGMNAQGNFEVVAPSGGSFEVRGAFSLLRHPDVAKDLDAVDQLKAKVCSLCVWHLWLPIPLSDARTCDQPLCMRMAERCGRALFFSTSCPSSSATAF